MIELRNLIQAYISERDSFFEWERYKWEAIKSFQKNYYRNDVSLEERLREPFHIADNILVSNNYYPASMLCTFAREKTDETQRCLDNLYDTSLPLPERIWAFINGTEKIFRTLKESGYSDWKDRTNVQSFQDPHAISIYLSLRYPQHYYFYKWKIFKSVAEKFGYTIKSRNKVDKLIEFYELCDTVKKEILKEKEFLAEYREMLKANDYTDPNYNLLTQDFIFAIATHMNADAYKKSSVGKVVETASSEYPAVLPKVKEEFLGKKGIDYAKQDELFRDLGKRGEMWVVNYEKERLAKQGIKYNVRHASILDGDGLGYDILSVEDDGITPRYIEVKTTTGGVERPFYFTKREMERSIKDADHYYLYRLYNFKYNKNQADVLIIKGSLTELNATPITYEVSI